MNTRINKLLSDLADCEADLVEATTADQAASIREDIHAIRHSLWLAGWFTEKEAAE